MSNGVPVKWANTTLDSLCHVEMGQSPPSSTYNESGEGLPFFQGKAEFTDLYPIASKWCTQPGKTARKGDVLLSVRAPVGPTNLAPADCCIGRGLAALSPLGGIDSRYVMYAIRSGVNALKKLSTGSTFDAVSGQKVREFQIPVAPLNEQHGIVAKIEELLSDLDAGIAALERARANLKRYRAAVLKAAVEGKLTEQWRKEHPLPAPGRARQAGDVEPASKLLERILAERRRKWEETQLARLRERHARGQAKYADAGKTPPKGWKDKYPEPAPPDTSALPELPQRWCWATVEQTAEVKGGIQKQPKRTPKANPFPYLRVANVFRNRLDLREMEYFELFGDELTKYRLEQGDLLVVEGNGSKTEIGRSAIWSGEVANCVHQNHIIRVRFLSGIPEFLNAYWNSPPGSGRVMHQAASTSGLYTLSVQKVSALPLPLPPLSEQQQIVLLVDERLSVIEKAGEEIEQQLHRASCLRQSILKRAFEGKLVPQDPNDLPAPRPGKWFVYALECDNRSIYIGQTRNVEERWKEHAAGRGAEWTRKHPPVKLVHWEEFDSLEAAVKREKQLKTGFGRKWLKREYSAGRTRQAGEPASVLLERIRAARAAQNPPRTHKRRKSPA